MERFAGQPSIIMKHDRARRRHPKVVEMLMDRGVDLNTLSGCYGHSVAGGINARPRGGGEATGRCRRRRNAQGGNYSNALQAASLEGHVKVVKMLMDGRADVNAQGGVYGTALHAASVGATRRW